MRCSQYSLCRWWRCSRAVQVVHILLIGADAGGVSKFNECVDLPHKRYVLKALVGEMRVCGGVLVVDMVVQKV